MTSPLLYEQLRAVMHGPAVRAKLNEVADKLQKRAQDLTGDPEDAAEILRVDGTRPGDNARDGVQRPYARVTVPVNFEFGGPNQTRMRVLGQAVAEL